MVEIRKNLQCVFCFKKVSTQYETLNANCIQKFLRLLSRFLNTQLKGGDNDGELFSCGECLKLAESFCNIYFKHECLRLQLEWRMKNLYKIMRVAGRVYPHVSEYSNQNKSDDEPGHENDSINVCGDIQQVRENILRGCRKKFLSSVPKVVLHSIVKEEVEEYAEIVPFWKQWLITFVIVYLSLPFQLQPEALQNCQPHSEPKGVSSKDKQVQIDHQIDYGGNLNYNKSDLKRNASSINQKIKNIIMDNNVSACNIENAERKHFTPNRYGESSPNSKKPKSLKYKCKKDYKTEVLQQEFQVVRKSVFKPYKCWSLDCQRKFADRVSRRRHYKLHFNFLNTMDVRRPPIESTREEIANANVTMEADKQAAQELQKVGTLSRELALITDSLLVPQSSSQKGDRVPVKDGLKAPIIFTCAICPSIFTSVEEFRNHMSNQHKQNWNYKCVTCGGMANTLELLKRHIIVFHGQSRIIDQEARSGYTRRSHYVDLTPERQERYGETQNNLPVTVETVTELEAPRLTDQNVTVIETQEAPIVQPSNALQNEVELVEVLTLKAADSAETHCAQSSLVSIETAQMGLTPQSPFTQQQPAHDHVSGSNDVQACVTMKQKDDNTSQLVRLYLCDFERCLKSYTRRRNLIAHQRTHTGDKPYRCSWESCGKSFTTSATLIHHRKTHVGEKPFRCGWEGGCSSKFTRDEDLKRHYRTHKQENPFLCQYCPSTFSRKYLLADHVKIAHHM